MAGDTARMLRHLRIEQWRSPPDGTRFLVHERISVATASMRVLHEEELPSDVLPPEAATRGWR